MSLLNIALIIIIIGVLLWLVNTYIPMEAMVKRILNIFVIIVLIIWLLKIFGLLSFLKSFKV